MNDTIIPLRVDIPNSWLNGRAEDYFVITVSRPDYVPCFAEGDFVLVDRRTDKPNLGGLYLVEIDNRLEFRIIYDNDPFTLHGVTPYIPPLADVEYSIIGIPRKIIRNI